MQLCHYGPSKLAFGHGCPSSHVVHDEDIDRTWLLFTTTAEREIVRGMKENWSYPLPPKSLLGTNIPNRPTIVLKSYFIHLNHIPGPCGCSHKAQGCGLYEEYDLGTILDRFGGQKLCVVWTVFKPVCRGGEPVG